MNWFRLGRTRERVRLHVAAVLLALPDHNHHGGDLGRRTRAAWWVYPVLAEFEAKGWVDSGWTRPQPGRRARRWYRVSEAGRDELAALLRGRS